MDYYRYYSTQRPVDIGTYPRRENVVNIHNYERRTLLDNGIRAWGYIDYNSPLTAGEISDYELSEPVVSCEEFTAGLVVFVDFHSIESAIRNDFPCIPIDLVETAALFYYRGLEWANDGRFRESSEEREAYLKAQATTVYNSLSRY